MANDVLVRTHGNAEIGYGHLIRALSLIESIHEKFSCLLFVSSDTNISLIPDNIDVEILPNRVSLLEEAAYFENNTKFRSKILVCDGYIFSDSYFRSFQERGYKTVLVDDFFNGKPNFLDVLINHAPGLSQSTEKHQNSIKYYLGPKYALIRKPFLFNNSIPDRVKDDFFICFGGADELNFTYYFTNIILSVFQNTSINIVVGSRYSYLNDLESLSINMLKNNNNLNIYQNVSDIKIKELMGLSKFAITSSSTILFEALSQKLFVFSGFYIDNQELIYRGFLAEQLIIGLDDLRMLAEKDAINIIKDFIDDKSLQEKLKSSLNTVFDGLSQERILKIFENEIL